MYWLLKHKERSLGIHTVVAEFGCRQQFTVLMHVLSFLSRQAELSSSLFPLGMGIYSNIYLFSGWDSLEAYSWNHMAMFLFHFTILLKTLYMTFSHIQSTNECQAVNEEVKI